MIHTRVFNNLKFAQYFYHFANYHMTRIHNNILTKHLLTKILMIFKLFTNTKHFRLITDVNCALTRLISILFEKLLILYKCREYFILEIII